MTIKTKRNAGLLNSSSLFVLGTASVLLGSGPAQAFDANSLPTGGNVTGGSATIATSGNTLTVNQSSNRTIIDWRGFNIGANAQANFVQPGTNSIAVNRVNGSTDPSRIDGGLHANGQVWVLNPNGVFFGKTARVDAAGIVATTANINDKAFMAGSNKLQMTGGDHGQVVNEGHISVGEGGLAAFVAPSVRNSGTIRARVGKVTLAAGDTYTLDLAGDRLVEIGLGSNKAVVDQSGKIINEGGVINISAKAAGQVVDAVINTSGVTDASSVRSVGGKIVLGADVINVASNASIKADGTSGGQITAVANKTGTYAGSYSAQGTTGDGGQIETSGKAIHIDNKIAVNTQSAKGKTGNWTLDPDDLTVASGGGGSISGGVNDDVNAAIDPSTVVTALNTTDVTLQARHTIQVSNTIDASGNANAHNLALNDQDGGGLSIDLDAAIILKGGATLSGQATSVHLANGGLIQNANDVALADTTINMGPGSYAAGATLNKAGLTLSGVAGTVINVPTGKTGITIGSGANNVTVQGIEFAGNITTPYYSTGWTAAAAQGVTAIAVAGTTSTGPSSFNINNNNIHDVRTGIIVQGASASGSITGNRVENTKGGILIQYNNGTPYTISGNSEGAVGNEWGIVLDLNDTAHWNTGTASSSWQASLLSLANGNGGMAVMDRDFASGNRTRVVVDAASTATAAQDSNLGNGLGNARLALSTISAGIDAVVAGGTVNVKAGTYMEQVVINKSLTLNGAGQGQTIIQAPDLLAPSTNPNDPDKRAIISASYGFKDDATVSNLTVDGLGKGDANPGFIGIGFFTSGGTVDHVTVTGVRNGGASGTLTGAQNGVGVLFDNKTYRLSHATLENSTITDFQKTGVVFTGGGMVANALNNTVTGAGHTGVIAQNGIEIYAGDVTYNIAGTISGNTISGISYAPVSDWSSSAILVLGGYEENGHGFSTTVVENNIVTGAGTGDYSNGIYVSAESAVVRGNTVKDFGWGVVTDYAYTQPLGVTNNLTVSNNSVTNNGVGLSVGYENGDNSIVTARGNDFSGNISGVELESADATLDATGNWWGTTNDATILAGMSGSSRGNVNFSSFLASGTNTATIGFGGDFSKLIVTTLGAGDNRISGAISLVDAGGIVNVGAGNFREQVVIAKNLTLTGAGSASTTIESPDVLTHSFTYDNEGVARKAVVSVEGANNVAINNLTIDGRGQAAANGAFVGLGLYNSGGTISDISITRVRAGGEAGTLGGGQTVYGLAAFNDAGTNTVTVKDSQITDFEKDGAAFYGHGLTANVTDNTITGAGATAANAQNGIVLIGANGDVTGNTLGGIGYSPDTFWATAIYLNDSAGTTVSGNTVNGAGGLAGSTLGVYAGNSAGAQITGNTFDGVEEGIDLATNATVTGNHFQNSANGIEIEASAAGADISGNIFTNNLTHVIGSDPTAVSGLLASNSFDRSVVTTGGEALYGDLQTAIDTEADNSTLNLAGTFGAGVNVNKVGDKLIGASGTVINVGAGQIGLTINADDVTVQNLEIAGPLSGAYTGLDWTAQPNSWAIQVTSPTIRNFNITGNNIHDVRTGILIANSGNPPTGGAQGAITGNTFENTKGGVIVQYRDGSTINIADNHQGAIGNEWGVVYNTNLNPAVIAATAGASRQSFLLDVSNTNNGLTVLDRGYTNANRTAVTVDASASGTPDNGFGNARQPLASINAGLDAVVAGGKVNVLTGTYAEDVAIIVPATVSFNNVTVDNLSVLSGGAGSTLSGSVKAGSVTAFDINLGGDLSLDTSAAGGTIALANVDGVHNLTLNAGSTGVVLAGGLGATTRLGAVDITADLIGLGATNKAASFDFNGDVALSAASTVIDTTVSSTAAGDITFAGDIFGTTDGGQSLTLSAGPGTGAKSVNGDITMNNAGISTVRLGSLNVSGDDFTALTVDLAGGFTSQLTGNQLFAADTLNAAGDVNSNVAGNIGGHIVSGGNVTLTAAGGVSGNISGKVVSLTGQTVNSQVTANTLNVNAPGGGTVTGTFTPGTVSNGLSVNGTVVGANTGGTGNTGTGNTGTGNTGTGNTGTGNTGTGNTGTGNTGTGNTGTGNTGTANNFPNVNGRQLVVEGFALPAGTQIGANGQLILPPGTVIGLLSPGGGTPRVIMVQSVQELGALLDQGYVAIVIDLTGHKKATTKVASN